MINTFMLDAFISYSIYRVSIIQWFDYRKILNEKWYNSKHLKKGEILDWKRLHQEQKKETNLRKLHCYTKVRITMYRVMVPYIHILHISLHKCVCPGECLVTIFNGPWQFCNATNLTPLKEKVINRNSNWFWEKSTRHR